MELLSCIDETLQANHPQIQSSLKNGDTKIVNRCSHLGSASFSPFGSKVSVIAHKVNYVERVVLEMIETERMYVQDLRSIVEDYLGGIIDRHELPMKPEQVSALFGNIEDIYELNSRLLQDLDNCSEDPVAVASCFVEKSHYFDIYTQYCNNYPNSVGILTECMRNKVLAQFFRERQEMLKHTLPLGSYLLKPVQRILKYHLLLQEIAKHFDVNKEGYEVVEEAIETMTGVAWYINDMKRKHEHAVRQQEIQSLLLNWKGLDLTTYGELVLEGTFRVQHARSERTFFLFDKALLITKKRGDHFVYKTHIPCSHLMLVESTRDSLCFTLTHYKNSKQQHNVQAKTVEEKHLWTHHIKKLILENHHAIIPQKAKEAILEMDAMYRGRYKYSPERLKKTMSVIDPTTMSQQSERRQSEPSKQILKHFGENVGLKMLDEMQKSHSESEVYIGGMICTTGIALEAPLATTANQPFQDGTERYSDVSKPLENGIVENAEYIKTLSSEEDEEETNILESSSILPSSVLDQASVIAERFINNLSRRSSLALEDGKGISYIAPRLSSRSSSLMNLNGMDKSLCQNESADFLKSHQVVLPNCEMVYAESSLSKVNSAENVFEEKDRSISKYRESILSFQDRQLIDKVKTYYDKAEYQDASFSIKRRESLAYIPAGVVKNSIFKINSLPRYNKSSSRRTIKISSSSSDCEREPLTTYENASTFEEKRGIDCSTLHTQFHVTFSKGEILEIHSPVSDEAFKCSSEIIKIWEEIEKEKSKNTKNCFISHPGKPLISVEEPVDPHEPLIILEKSDFGDIKEEYQNQTPEDLSPKQLRSRCANVSFNDQEFKTPFIDHPTLMELASHMDVNLSDNITNRVYQLARQYSQRIKCNKPVPYRRLKEIEDDMRRGSLSSVKEEKNEAKYKLKTLFSFPMSDHIVSQEHSLTTPMPAFPSEKSPKRLSFLSTDSPDISSPLKFDCRSLLSPVITENFHWPDVRELRSRYTNTAGDSRDLPDNRSQSVPDKMDHNMENVTDTQDKDCINHSYEKNIHHSYPQNVLSEEKNLFNKTYIQRPNMTVSTETMHNGNCSQTIDDCYYISAEALLENNGKVIIVEKSPAAYDVDDTYVHIRSPTTREKISIKAVIERCKAYQDSEVYKMGEDLFNSEGSTGIRQDQSKPKVLSSNDTQQNRVKNLREKFQTLNSRVSKPSEFI